jgi:hypothetical protein
VTGDYNRSSITSQQGIDDIFALLVTGVYYRQIFRKGFLKRIQERRGREGIGQVIEGERVVV